MIEILLSVPTFNPNWVAHKDLTILRGKIKRFEGYTAPTNKNKGPFPRNIVYDTQNNQ